MPRDEWLTLSELIDAVGTPAPTSRQIETWRGRALIPRPVRWSGGRSVWRYPPGTDEQLRRLLYWRARIGELELIRIQLWLEWFPVSLAAVRKALDAFVAAWESGAARQRASLGGDTAQGIDALGRQLAGKRGSAAIPRVVRMTADERAKAHAYMLAVELGLDTEVERRAPDAIAVERMLGLRSGQGGGLATSLDLADGIHDLTAVPPPARMRDAIASASVAEFEIARRLGAFIQAAMPSLAPYLLTDEGPKAEPFARIIDAVFADVPPAATAQYLIVTLTKLRANPLAEDDIRNTLQALAPSSMELALLELVPEGSKRLAFDRLPERHRRQIETELRRRVVQRRS